MPNWLVAHLVVLIRSLLTHPKKINGCREKLKRRAELGAGL
jgi:hypothetical protein